MHIWNCYFDVVLFVFFFCSRHLQHCISASAMFCLHPIEQQINPVSHPLEQAEPRIQNKKQIFTRFQTSIFFLRQASSVCLSAPGFPDFSPTCQYPHTSLTYRFFVVRNRSVSDRVPHWFSLLKSYRSTWVWLSRPRALTHPLF